jgi:hypothetical protein
MTKAPSIELRPKVPGTFDIFVNGCWIGTIQYLWETWHFTHMGRSLDLKPYPSSQSAVAALVTFHAKRMTRGDEMEGWSPT